jgi:hypothetical protein
MEYSDAGFVNINQYLRGDIDIVDPSVIEDIENIDKYFRDDAPRITEDDVMTGKNIVWRGEGGRDFFTHRDPMRAFRSGITQSYLSTSARRYAADGFTGYDRSLPYGEGVRCCLYKYILDVGVPYININQFVRFNCTRSEAEILLPRGLMISFIEHAIEDVEGHGPTHVFTMGVSIPPQKRKADELGELENFKKSKGGRKQRRKSLGSHCV